MLITEQENKRGNNGGTSIGCEDIHSLKEGVLSVKVLHKKREAKGSGLCGIWKDERSAAEIIKDIRLRRTGFDGREPNPMDRESEDYLVK